MPFAKINGTTLHYQVKGEGLPIIFIHPPLLTKANFNYQVAQLSGIYKVITFDIRGHGHSAASLDPLTYLSAHSRGYEATHGSSRYP
jgi:pimeloyl-ACP methyl ester carboxylesterase